MFPRLKYMCVGPRCYRVVELGVSRGHHGATQLCVCFLLVFHYEMGFWLTLWNKEILWLDYFWSVVSCHLPCFGMRVHTRRVHTVNSSKGIEKVSGKTFGSIFCDKTPLQSHGELIFCNNGKYIIFLTCEMLSRV